MNKIWNNEFEGTSETQEERDELYVAGYFPMLDSFHNDKKNIATCANWRNRAHWTTRYSRIHACEADRINDATDQSDPEQIMTKLVWLPEHDCEN